jgi:hypothetical protein
MVAVDDLPVLVADDQPVAVAVEGQADIAPSSLRPWLGHQLRVQGAAAVVDVGAVRVDAEGGDLGAELLEDMGGHP